MENFTFYEFMQVVCKLVECMMLYPALVCWIHKHK